MYQSEPDFNFKSEGTMAKLLDIEGVGPVYSAKLKAAGVGSTQVLLDKGSTPKGRKEIAEKSGITETLILEWVNHVDLFRIKGVAEEYADLLEEAGVDTVPELAQRKAENLFQKLVAVNEAKKLVRRLPVLSQVESWIEQAKKLPRVISY
jgi:predicted flap endonuclease-1-like 5' DNA nuclease